jgi:hypothetical protein
MTNNQLEEMQKSIYKEFKSLFDLDEDLFNLFGDTIDKCNLRKMPFGTITSIQNVVGFLSTKAFKTYVAIFLLCKNGAGQDAEILLRSLIEILINVKYLLKADSITRADMYIRYFDFKTARDIKILKDDPRIGAKIKEYEEEYDKKKEEFVEKYDPKNKNSWSGKSVAEMAEEAGLKEIYFKAYNSSSNIVHSNILCSNQYVKYVEGRIDFEAGPSNSCVERVLASSIECLINILMDFNNVFNIGNDQNIRNFVEKYNKEITILKGKLEC